MNIIENKLSESSLELIVELERADIEADLQKAAKHIAERLNIPGFRPGQAPYDVVSRHIGGEAKIYEEALQNIVSRTLPKIIIEKKLETVGRPEISIQTMVPPFGVSYKAVVNLLPKVELGDVSKIKAKSKEVKVDAAEVDKVINQLLEMRISEAAGERTKPEFNDEFAQNLGGYESASKLREQIELNLKQEKNLEEKERFELECMEELLKISQVGPLPARSVDEEVDKMLHELEHSVTDRGLKFEDYLQSIKKTRDELAREFRPKAEHRLRLGLVTREFGKQENVAVSDKEVQAEIDLVKKAYQNNPESMAQFSSAGYKDYVRNVLTSRRIFETLGELVK